MIAFHAYLGTHGTGMENRRAYGCKSVGKSKDFMKKKQVLKTTVFWDTGLKERNSIPR
jgi:hypothetical protein